MLLCNPKTMQQLGALIQNLQFGVESANVSVDTAAAAPAVNLAALVQNYMATAAVTPTPVASSTQDLIQLLLQKKHQQEQQRENTAQLILQHLQNQQWERQTEALKNLTSPSSNPTTMVLLNQLFQQQQRQALQR
jgi:GTPase SAR1 family protein